MSVLEPLPQFFAECLTVARQFDIHPFSHRPAMDVVNDPVSREADPEMRVDHLNHYYVTR